MIDDGHGFLIAVTWLSLVLYTMPRHLPTRLDSLRRPWAKGGTGTAFTRIRGKDSSRGPYASFVVAAWRFLGRTYGIHSYAAASRDIYFFDDFLKNILNFIWLKWNFGCIIENGWCLFPWNSKRIINKLPQSWSPPAEKLEKIYISVGSVIYMVISSPQHGENTAFFSSFSLGGLYGWDILLVILFELQGKRHQPFSMIQPFSMLLRQNNHILWQRQIFIENVNVSASRQGGLSRGSLARMPPSLSALLFQLIQTCRFRFAPSEVTG